MSGEQRSDRPFPSEAALEEEFLTLFLRTRGRVFITWSAQNIDRTVTIYRACKQAGRTLVLDIYTLDVLDRLSASHSSLPRLGWPNLSAVVTAEMKRLYERPDRVDYPSFVERCVASGRAISAARLVDMDDCVVMLRPSLLRDFERKGLKLQRNDAWVFSMWSGYLRTDPYQRLRETFAGAGAGFAQIHTSGHASQDDLSRFAKSMNPKRLIPIHSFTWDQHVSAFPNVIRLNDGEPLVLD